MTGRMSRLGRLLASSGICLLLSGMCVSAAADTEGESVGAVRKFLQELGGKGSFFNDRLMAVAASRQKEVIRHLILAYRRSSGEGHAVLEVMLVQMGPVAVKPLTEELGNTDMWVRNYSAELLGKIGDRRAVEPLIRQLFDRKEVAASAAKALNRINPDWRNSKTARNIVPSLITVLKKGDVPVELKGGLTASLVEQARRESERLSPPRGRRSGQEDPKDAERRKALEEHRRSMKRMTVRAVAARALGHLKDRRALDALIIVLDEPSVLTFTDGGTWGNDAWDEALWALREIDHDWARTEKARPLVDGWLKTINKSTSGKERDNLALNAAVTALGYAGDSRAVKPLLKVFEQGRFRRRGRNVDRDFYYALDDLHRDLEMDVPDVSCAGEALVRIGDKSVLGDLERIAKGGPKKMNKAAAMVLARLGGEDAVAPLSGLLKKSSVPTEVLIMAMVETESPKAVAALMPLLEFNQAEHDRTVERIVKEREKRYKERGRKLRDRDRDYLRQSAVRQARQAQVSTRVLAAWGLGRLGGRSAVKPLLSCLRDGTAPVRAAAMWALGRIGDPEAVPAAVDVLSELRVAPEAIGPALGLDDDEFVPSRRATKRAMTEYVIAADALGRIGDKRAIEPLILTMSTGMPRAYVALMRLDSKWATSSAARSAVPKLLPGLDAESVREKVSTAMLLTLIGDTRAVEPMIERLGNPATTSTYVAALGRLKPNWALSPTVRAQVPRLIKQLNETEDAGRPDRRDGYASVQRRVSAAELLGHIRDARAVHALMERFKGKPPTPRRNRWGRTGGPTDEEKVRIACAQALGRLKDPRSVDILMQAFQRTRNTRATRRTDGTEKFLYTWSESRTIRMAAVDALAELNDPKAVDPLLTVFDGKTREESRSSEVGRFSGRHSGPPPRTLEKAVAEALGRLADKRAIPSLVNVLADAHVMGRREILPVLDKLDPEWRKSPEAAKTTRKLLDGFLASPAQSALRWEMGQAEPARVRMLNALNRDWRKTPHARAVADKLTQTLESPGRGMDLAGRQAVMKMLTIIKGEECMGLLVRNCVNGDHYTRKSALRALKEFNPRWVETKAAKACVPMLVKKLKEGRRSYPDAGLVKLLVQIDGRGAKDVLMAELVHNSKRRMREREIYENGQGYNRNVYGSGRVHQHVNDLARIIAPILAGEDLKKLMGELKKPDTTMAYEVGCLVHYAELPVDPKPLLEALLSEDTDIRMAGWLGLIPASGGSLEHAWWTKLKTTSAFVPKLIKGLDSKEPKARTKLVMVLAAIKDKRALGPMMRLLVDEDAEVRRVTRYELDRMDRGWPKSEAAAKAAHFFTRALNAETPAVRTAAMEILRHVGVIVPTETMGDKLKDPDQNVRLQAVEQLTGSKGARAGALLAEVLTDERQSDRLRWAAAEALGRRGDKSAVKPLLEVLSGPDRGPKPAVATALGRLGDKQAVTPLIKALKYNLKEFQNMPVASTTALSNKNSQYVRIIEACAEALGKLGDKRAAPAIDAAMKVEKLKSYSRTFRKLKQVRTALSGK